MLWNLTSLLPQHPERWDDWCTAPDLGLHEIHFFSLSFRFLSSLFLELPLCVLWSTSCYLQADLALLVFLHPFLYLRLRKD